MQQHSRQGASSRDPRFDIRPYSRDYRARERSPDRDPRQRGAPGYNNRRARSPLPGRESCPRHDNPEHRKETYAGNSPESPDATHGVSMLGKGIPDPHRP